jgi:hypothetical protein
VSNADLPSYTPNEFRQRRLNELDQAATTGKIPPLLLRRWEHAMEDVSLWRFNPCVVHGDLHEDNLLVDGDRVTAVTGWTDLRIGDPADDMAWLVASNEQDFVNAVLDHYTSNRRDVPDAHLLRRAALSAEFALAQYLVKGMAAGNQDMIDEADSMLATLAEDVAEHGGQPISVEPLPQPVAAPGDGAEQTATTGADADGPTTAAAAPAAPALPAKGTAPAVSKVTLLPMEPAPGAAPAGDASTEFSAMPAVHVTPIPRETESDAPAVLAQPVADTDTAEDPAGNTGADANAEPGAGSTGDITGASPASDATTDADATKNDAPQAVRPDADAGDAGERAGAEAPPADDTSTQSIAVIQPDLPVQPDSAVQPNSTVQPDSDDNTSTAAITVVDTTSR